MVSPAVLDFIGGRTTSRAYSFAPNMLQSSLSPSVGASVVDFIVVVSNEDEYLSSFHEFAENVNRKLRAGYRLHGQPFNIGKALCQSLVKCEGTPAGGSASGDPCHPGDKR
jgi:hypothetical protein